MTRIGDLTLASPVLVASGCGGTGRELSAYVDLARLGAFVTRSISVDPRAGGPTPRVAETPSGLVHATGLPNVGIDQFLAIELPWLLQAGAKVVVSVVGRDLGEYAELGRRLGRAPGVSAVEINLSAPDAVAAGLLDIREPFLAAGVVAAVLRELPRGVPVLAKLRPDVLRVAETARAALDAGAAAVVVGNAQPAALPDGRAAGLSGPAVRPLALRCVAEVRAALPDATVVACGGIVTGVDARTFLDAGASAVQVGSALMHDPTAATRIMDALADPDHGHAHGPGSGPGPGPGPDADPGETS